MTPQEFGIKLRELIDASGLSVHMAVKVRVGEKIYGKVLMGGEPPYPKMDLQYAMDAPEWKAE
jgi:hypothetical protein